MSEKLKFALAGNPNCGKTTLFNAITGSKQHVGNYPGITVEYKEGATKVNNAEVGIIDLPGCYSMTAYSEEELVSRNFLVDERPDVVIDVIAAPSLERNLYLAVQFLELGIPTILALNMVDELKKQGTTINSERLGEVLGVPVVETVARSGTGREKLLDAAIARAHERKGEWKPLVISYGPDLDRALGCMSEAISKEKFMADKYPASWIALKYLEEDEDVIRHGDAAGPLSEELKKQAQRVRQHCRETLGTTPEALIADYRYGYIASVLKEDVIQRDTHRERVMLSDKIDRVLTHQFLGPVVMVGVLYMIFQLTFTVGEIPMGWVEYFFGFLSDTAQSLIPEGMLRSLVVSGIIDGVGGVLVFVPFIMIMFILISILEDSGYMARVAYMLDRVFRIFGLHGCSVMPFIISGGISGGCAVPGVMASRTLRSKKEKLATLLTAPFMVCGAKVPVFIMVIAAVCPKYEVWAMLGITLGGWVAALLVAKFLRSTIISGESTPFLMELPPYRMPTFRGVMIHMWDRTWSYIKKAGTVILAISVLLWAAMTFPGLPEKDIQAFETKRAEARELYAKDTGEEAGEKLAQAIAGIDDDEAEESLRNSYAGRVGIALESVSKYAGFDWRVNIALTGGFAAKEVIVSTMATAYSLGEVEADDSGVLSDRVAADKNWNAAKGLSLIVFVLIYAPCFVTVVTIARESSWQWALFTVVFDTALAFILAVGVYQIGLHFI
ncbi:MAG: ferrous iron transport protein B [Planctomycetes bacterium]|nr:ferrous iron transport protein B [Planctomycetota bacterium]